MAKRKLDKSVSEEICARIRAAMYRRGFNQLALARGIGVTPSMVSYMMSGRGYPNVVMLARIAKCLNVSADYLLGLSDDSRFDMQGNQTVQIDRDRYDTLMRVEMAYRALGTFLSNM